LEGVNPFKDSDICGLPKVIFPSRQGCLEGEMTFGDPFEDPGVDLASPKSDFRMGSTIQVRQVRRIVGRDSYLYHRRVLDGNRIHAPRQGSKGRIYGT
jgi:hypothetical protein